MIDSKLELKENQPYLFAVENDWCEIRFKAMAASATRFMHQLTNLTDFS